jgi:hypothetical protein
MGAALAFYKGLEQAESDTINFSFTNLAQGCSSGRGNFMRHLLLWATLLATVAIPVHVIAAEPSPWFGSSEQVPFQLDASTKVAVTFAADPLQTGATSEAPCLPGGCTTQSKAATRPMMARGIP